MTMHPFTGVEITDKGIELLSDYVGKIRDVVGMEVPLSSDHFGHIGVNSCIKLARAMEKWNLAWMEDMVPWQFGELMKMIKDSTTVPILTGEDIYLKEDFIKLIDMGAVDAIHPDLASVRRDPRDQEDRRLRHGARRPHGHALRGVALLLHGQRPLRVGHRELRRPRAPLAGRARGGTTSSRPSRRSSTASRWSRTAPASASTPTPRSSRSTSRASTSPPPPSGTRSAPGIGCGPSRSGNAVSSDVPSLSVVSFLARRPGDSALSDLAWPSVLLASAKGSGRASRFDSKNAGCMT